MKELSIEEKAQRYDEAIKEASIAYKDEDRHLKATLERIFPEFRESEDEKIRKELITFIKKRDRSGCDYDYDQWIAWLEKQKPIQNINKEDEKVSNENIKACIGMCLTDVYEQKFKDFNVRLKDCLAWLEKAKEALYDKLTNEEDETSISINNPEAYRIGFADGEAHAKEEISAAWGEEDEHRIKDTIYFLETAKKHYASTVELDACIDWLKSIRPQNTWKPTDEQIDELENEYLKSIPKY